MPPLEARGNAVAAAAFTKINDAAAGLLDTVDGADAPPTQQATAAVGDLERRFDALKRR